MEPDINFASPEWGRVRLYLQDELKDTQERLTSSSATVEELRALQGKALFIKKMLGFGE